MRNTAASSFAILILITFSVRAQYTLTQANHAPQPGITKFIVCDSTAPIPKLPGNQIWDFQSLNKSANVITTTYLAMGGACNDKSFASASLAKKDNYDYCQYYRSDNTGFYEIGFMNGTKTVSYNKRLFTWPFTFGNSFQHSFTIVTGLGSGNQYSQFYQTHNYTVTASGSGTIILPGGQTVDYALQVVTSDTIVYRGYASGMYTDSSFARIITYDYFSPDDRSPVLTIIYYWRLNTFPAGTTRSVTVLLNSLFPTKVNEEELAGEFNVFPNPSSGDFQVEFLNSSGQVSFLHLYNSTGQLVQIYEAGSAENISLQVSCSDLSAGIYFLRVVQGSVTAATKRVVLGGSF
jgi:hypothetical protein